MEPDAVSSVYTQICLPALSIELTALVLVVTLPAAAIIGYLAGANRRRAVLAKGEDVDLVAGETTISAILALLGLLLAFSYGNALSLSQARKSSVVNEAAALGTAFLRADYLPEPGRTELRQALLAYAETRVLPGGGRIRSLEAAQAFIARTLTAQAALWPLTLEVTADPLAPPLKTLVAGAVNEALDAHLYRVETLSNPVSEITHAMVLASALLALFLLGNRTGLVGRKLTWRTFVFSGILFVVMMTIVDTQRGGEGFVRLDHTTLIATIVEMRLALDVSGG